MKFHYQLHDCIIPINKWLLLQYHVFMLMFRRLLKFCKRTLFFFKSYIPTIICIILFEIIIIPLGIQHNKFTSWLSGIWDLRSFMLTSVFISIVVGLLTSGQKRHSELQFQYRAYEEFKYASENFVISLCNAANYKIDSNFFLTESQFDSFYKNLEHKIVNLDNNISLTVIEDKHFLYSTKEIPRLTYIIINISRYYRSIERLNTHLVNHNFIGSIDHAISQLNYIFDEIQAEQILIDTLKDSYTDAQLLKFVDSISRCILPAVADIRRPWRWDVKRNEQINTIINNSLF